MISAFKTWRRAKLALISQKSRLAVAIRYALSRWEGLTLLLDDDGMHSKTTRSKGLRLAPNVERMPWVWLNKILAIAPYLTATVGLALDYSLSIET